MTDKTDKLLADFTEQARHMGYLDANPEGLEVEAMQEKKEEAKVDFDFARQKLIQRIEKIERKAGR